MKVIQQDNGDICISELGQRPYTSFDDKDVVLKTLALLDKLDITREDFFHTNSAVFYYIFHAEKYAEKNEDYDELLCLKDAVLCIKKRISFILKKHKEVKDEDIEPKKLVLRLCPCCGAPPELRYYGYSPAYFCSNKECYYSGERGDTVAEAAYNWNMENKQSVFKSAVESVKRLMLPAEELDAVSCMLFEIVMKKSGILCDNRDVGCSVKDLILEE